MVTRPADGIPVGLGIAPYLVSYVRNTLVILTGSPVKRTKEDIGSKWNSENIYLWTWKARMERTGEGERFELVGTVEMRRIGKRTGN